MDLPDLLTATIHAGHLVLDPRCFCGNKPLGYLKRGEARIHFQSLNITHRIVKPPSKSCISSTNIYPEHSAPPSSFLMLWGYPFASYYQHTQESLPYGKSKGFYAKLFPQSDINPNLRAHLVNDHSKESTLFARLTP
jgi:hypothetical protein